MPYEFSHAGVPYRLTPLGAGLMAAPWRLEIQQGPVIGEDGTVGYPWALVDADPPIASLWDGMELARVIIDDMEDFRPDGPTPADGHSGGGGSSSGGSSSGGSSSPAPSSGGVAWGVIAVFMLGAFVLDAVRRKGVFADG